MTIDGMTTSLRIVIGGETEIVIATVATIAGVVMTATMATTVAMATTVVTATTVPMATTAIVPAAFSAVSGLESATNINRSHLKMPRRTSRHFLFASRPWTHGPHCLRRRVAAA